MRVFAFLVMSNLFQALARYLDESLRLLGNFVLRPVVQRGIVVHELQVSEEGGRGGVLVHLYLLAWGRNLRLAKMTHIG